MQRRAGDAAASRNPRDRGKREPDGGSRRSRPACEEGRTNSAFSSLGSSEHVRTRRARRAGSHRAGAARMSRGAETRRTSPGCGPLPLGLRRDTPGRARRVDQPGRRRRRAVARSPMVPWWLAIVKPRRWAAETSASRAAAVERVDAAAVVQELGEVVVLVPGAAQASARRRPLSSAGARPSTTLSTVRHAPSANDRKEKDGQRGGDQPPERGGSACLDLVFVAKPSRHARVRRKALARR